MRHNISFYHKVLGILGIFLTACSSPSSDPPPPISRAHRVAVAQVSRASLGEGLVLTGTLEARRRVRAFSPEEGRIATMPFFEGDRVEAGEVLVRLDDRLLRAELDRAVALRRQAELDVERLAGLAARHLASGEAIARARTALAVARAEEAMLRIRLEDMTIRAPFAGIISERLAEPGDGVAAHTHLLTLFDPSSLTLRIRVSELLLARLEVGQGVEVQVDALGKSFPGFVIRLFPAIDGLGQGTVEVALDPLPRGARPGQFCRVRIPSIEALSIPFAALQRDRQGTYVFLLEKGKVRRVDVGIGLRFGRRVAVIDGLDAGQRVVVKGFLGLRDGMAVKVVDG